MKMILLMIALASVPCATGAAVELPQCRSSERDVDVVLQSIRAFPKTPQKYDGYRSVLSGESDAALVARLAYAETLATNCSELNSRILPLITDSILNRIRIRKGDVKGVVFQRDQYSSSLNFYQESRFRDFLCPQSGELWAQALTVARGKLASLEKTGRLPVDAVHYYLYKHSERLATPDWATDRSQWAIVEIPGEQDLKPCLRFFRNPKWH